MAQDQQRRSGFFGPFGRRRGVDPLDELGEHHLRDIGYWRERSARPRQWSGWMWAAGSRGRYRPD